MDTPIDKPPQSRVEQVPCLRRYGLRCVIVVFLLYNGLFWSLRWLVNSATEIDWAYGLFIMTTGPMGIVLHDYLSGHPEIAKSVPQWGMVIGFNLIGALQWCFFTGIAFCVASKIPWIRRIFIRMNHRG